MRRNSLILGICILTGIFSGCSDDDGGNYDWKESFLREQTLIENFVKDKDATIKEYPFSYKGEDLVDRAYIFDYEKDGKKAENGHYLLINFTTRSIADGKVLDSTDPSLAVGSGINAPYYALGGPVYYPVYVTIDPEKYTDPVADMLKMIPEGTEGSIVMSSMLSGAGYILYRDYTVEKVLEESVFAYEKKMIANYLKGLTGIEGDIIDVPLTDGNDTITKIAMIRRNPTGKDITKTDSVKVDFEAFILDEINAPHYRWIVKDDEGKAQTWAVGKILTGLSEALCRMHQDEEAYIVIPYGMGYKGSGRYDVTGNGSVQCIIPAYSTLVYRLKITEVKSK